MRLAHLTILALALGPMEAAAACLRYDEPVRITGTLVRKTLPGPPNFESVARGDKALTYWFLRPDRPVCVDESPAKDGIDAAQQDVREIQLVLAPEQYKTFHTLVDKPVTGVGTLFGQHSGHHMTPVLLNVKDLRAAKGRD